MAINGKNYDWEDAAAVSGVFPAYGWRQSPMR